MSSQPTSHQELGVAGIMRQCNLALSSERAAADLVSRKGKMQQFDSKVPCDGWLSWGAGRQGGLASSTAAGVVGVPCHFSRV